MSLLETLLLVAALVLLLAVVVGAWLMIGDALKVVGGALRRAVPVRRTRQRVARQAWDEVILPEDAKEELLVIQRILRDPLAYRKRWGQAPPRGMILHGPPGTGKTLIARTLAHEMGYHFLSVSTADVKDKYLGEGERRLREVYRRARKAAPCIVFLDELEGLGAGRSSAENDPGGAGRAQNSLTSQLLQELDGFERFKKLVFTVGATNHLELVDEALRSRLSYQLHLDLPDRAAREQLFHLYTRPYGARLDFSVTALAEASAGMSGRDIETVCAVAPMLAHGTGKNAVGYEELRRAFARVNHTLELEPCPACSGQEADCPICAGAALARS